MQTRKMPKPLLKIVTLMKSGNKYCDDQLILFKESIRSETYIPLPIFKLNRFRVTMDKSYFYKQLTDIYCRSHQEQVVSCKEKIYYFTR